MGMVTNIARKGLYSQMTNINLTEYLGSFVEYDKYEPGNSSIILQCSWDGGETWLDVPSGYKLPGKEIGDSLEGTTLMLRSDFNIVEGVETITDLPEINNISILFFTELEGEIFWLGEDGEEMQNNIEVGKFSDMEIDDSKSLNLWIKTDGLTFRIRTKDYDFGTQHVRHQLRKLLLDMESSGGNVYVNIYVDDKIVSTKELELEGGSHVWGPHKENVLVWNEGQWGPFEKPVQDFFSTGIENIGNRISFEVVAQNQTIFRLRGIWSEFFHRRKV